MEFETGRNSKNRSYNRKKPQHESEVISELGKTQPQDVAIEEAVLGALMLEKGAFSVVSDILKPECFYEHRNQLIYQAIVSLGVKQRPIDMLTVTDQLRLDGNLDEAGGAIRISDLTGRVSSAANIEYHARIVVQKYLARELISFSSNVSTKAFDDTIDVYDLMQEAEGKLFELSKNTLKREAVQIDGIITDAINKIQEASNRKSGLSGLRTGYTELDKVTSGWQNSDLIIIAARPAMGKTALVLSMAKNMAVDYNIPVAVFSLEMSNIQLVNRLISNVCEIKGEQIKSGQLSIQEWDVLMSRVKQLYSAPIYVDDTPSLSIFELRTKARRLVREHGVQMIIIDYLQLKLAKELDIPIIALSQLNRSVEQRGDDKRGKRPQLSDLRESGAIEQDADIVCFIHRPEYYTHSSEDSEGNDIRGLAEFIIAKHRSGSIGTIKMRFVARYARFENWDDSLAGSPNAPKQEVYASRMNNEDTGNMPPSAPPPTIDDYTAGNVDFQLDSNEETPPF